MFRILTPCCIALILGVFNPAAAAGLSELLGLNEALEAPAARDSVGGAMSGITSLLNSSSDAVNGSVSALSNGGCVAPIFSTYGSPIIGGELGGPTININISINIDIDITFIGSCCQPVASATRCN